MDSGAFECFSALSPIETIVPHLKGLADNAWLKRKLTKLIFKERQELLLEYDSDSHLYTKERYLNLEDHVKILEDYKREAESLVLMMEEENLKLKKEMINYKEELSGLKQQNVAGKWRLAALKDKRNKDFVNKTLSKKLGEEIDFSPIQNIARAVGKLTKVTELLDIADLKNVLTGVMASLSNSDLYSPTRQTLDKLELDEMTKKYIVTSFTGLASGQNNEDKEEREQQAPTAAQGQKVVDRTNERILGDLGYNVWSFSLIELEGVITVMFDNLGFLDDFLIPLDLLSNFVRTLQRSYKTNPFHNFQHAFDVSQMCYIMLTKSKAYYYLSKMDQLAIIVGALCHDVCHPGTTNAFQVNVQSELAMIYNDQSVLENFHCSKAFSILNDENCSSRTKSGR